MSDIVERLRIGTTCSGEEMNKRHEAANKIKQHFGDEEKVEYGRF